MSVRKDAAAVLTTKPSLTDTGNDNKPWTRRSFRGLGTPDTRTDGSPTRDDGIK